jgi:hypothetical protein
MQDTLMSCVLYYQSYISLARKPDSGHDIADAYRFDRVIYQVAQGAPLAGRLKRVARSVLKRRTHN